MDNKAWAILADIVTNPNYSKGYAWATVVAQAKVHWITYAGTAAFIAGLDGLSLWWIIKRSRKEPQDQVLIWITWACFAIFTFVGLLMFLPSALTALMNPEFWALNKIRHF